jgi:hypothetical protein
MLSSYQFRMSLSSPYTKELTELYTHCNSLAFMKFQATGDYALFRRTPKQHQKYITFGKKQ